MLAGAAVIGLMPLTFVRVRFADRIFQRIKIRFR